MHGQDGRDVRLLQNGCDHALGQQFFENVRDLTVFIPVELAQQALVQRRVVERGLQIDRKPHVGEIGLVEKAGHGQDDRPGDAEMGEQHLPEKGSDPAPVAAACRQRDVFQGQPLQRLAAGTLDPAERGA